MIAPIGAIILACRQAWLMVQRQGERTSARWGRGCWIALFSTVRVRFWRFEWSIIGMGPGSGAWKAPECFLFVLGRAWRDGK